MKNLNSNGTVNTALGAAWSKWIQASGAKFAAVLKLPLGLLY